MALSLGLALALAGREARGDGRDPSEPPAAEEEAGPLRTPEEYRGRPPRSHPGRAWLWVPRALLFPLWALSEFAVREPALAVGRWAEHSHLGSYVGRATHPLPGLSWGPSFEMDLGLRPSFGLAARVADREAPGASVAVITRTGGESVWYLAARGDVASGPLRAGISALYAERPDAILADPHAPALAPLRFHWARSDARAYAGLAAGPHARLDLSAGLREDDTSEAPGTPAAAAQHPPAGMGRVRTAYGRAHAALDTRERPAQLQGARLEVWAHYGADTGAEPWRFVVADAEASAALAFAGGRAALGLMAYAADSDGVGGGAVPFTELPTLGGERFRGFLPGRFRGESAAAAELRLHVEAGNDLELVLAAGAGNVFDQHLADFDARALVAESWVALRSRSDPRGSVELLVGAGTNRFDQPFGIETMRLGASLNRDLF